MALTWKEDADSRQDLGMSGIIQCNVASFAASDYVTGGYPVAPSAFAFGYLRGLIQLAFTGTAYLYSFKYNAATGKLQAFEAITGAASGDPAVETEVPAGTDLSGGTVTFLAYGF